MDIFSKAVEKAAEERRTRLNEDFGDGDTAISRPRMHGIDDLQNIEYRQTTVTKTQAGSGQVIRTSESDDDLTPSGHAYNILRTRVLQRLQQSNWNLLAVTSPSKGNGKTTTSVNLATSIARSVNHTVLLIDLDLRRPSVHRHFGIEPTVGITDLIMGTAKFSDVVFNPRTPRLTVLPGRERISHSSEFLSAPRMRQFVQEVRERYPQRIILFDMPPVLGGADVLSFLPIAQCSLLVVEAGRTTKEELRGAMKALENTHVIGTVLNRGTVDVKAYY